MNLKEMQSLPHKWWKKDVNYIPCDKDLPIELGSFRTNASLNKENLSYLNKLTLHNPNLIPTLYDWLYAINTELLEFHDTPSPVERYKEMADVAIFCALCLKYYYQYDILATQLTKQVTIKPIYSYEDPFMQIIDTLIWSSSSPFIPYKINFNKERIDHGHFRH